MFNGVRSLSFLAAIFRIGLLLVVAAPSVARADYVFFYRTIGDWVVLCASDAASGRKHCDLNAPPPSLSHAGVQNILHVTEPTENSFEVWVEVRDIVVPGLPAFLRVDGFAIHESQIVDGRASWTGQDALNIIAEMTSGLTVVYRVQTVPDGMPRDMHVALGGFKDALSMYRGVVREHGLIAAAK